MRWPCVFWGYDPFRVRKQECVGRILIECIHTWLGSFNSLVRLIQALCMLYQKMVCFFAGIRLLSKHPRCITLV